MIPEISKPKLSPDRRFELGRTFKRKIDNAESDRSERVDIWNQARSNYEQKAVKENFPWPDASNALIPITPTHTNAIRARLYNTVVGQDQVFIVLQRYDGVIPGTEVEAERFALAMQNFSDVVEREEIPIEEWYAEVADIVTKFGDAFVYTTFDNFTSKKAFASEDGEPNFVEDRFENRPVKHVIHPKDFWSATPDVQKSPWCAFQFDIEPGTLKAWRDQNFYNKAAADEVLEAMGALPQIGDKEGDYFKGQGSMEPHDDRIARERDQDAGQNRSEEVLQWKVYVVFARLDIDDDKKEEEVVMHIDAVGGRLLRLAWPEEHHGERPIDHYRYLKRTGSVYSTGVPEILFNIQKNMNIAARQMENANTVSMTSAFTVLAGSRLAKGRMKRIYPMRQLVVDTQEDIQPLDTGPGRINLSLADIDLMDGWGQRATGITDFNLGQERTSRTPATTTLALLEESNKRIDEVIRLTRRVLLKAHIKDLQLYMQFYREKDLVPLVGPEDAAVLAEVWRRVRPRELMNFIGVDARVSTQNLNRAVLKQEALALFGQLERWGDLAISLATMRSQAIATQDAGLQQFADVLLGVLTEGNRRVLNSFGEHDIEKLNPELGGTIAEIATPLESGGGGALPGQVDAAQNAVANQGTTAGPVNPPGRPIAGRARPQAALVDEGIN